MNYYNPYFNAYPYMMGISQVPRVGLMSRIFGRGINFSSILSGTQKTLNVVNQTIPIIKQATPIMKNAKTMFKVMNEFKKVDTPTSNNPSNIVNNINQTYVEETFDDSYRLNNYGPTFFA